MRTQLDEFVNRYTALNVALSAPFDAEWRSPCEVGDPFTTDTGTMIGWQPIARGPADDFAGLAHALETDIHPDIQAYYAGYWSDHLEAQAEEGHVSLLMLWNPEDAERLVENLIGHALAQHRSRSPLSLFFACTEDDSELFLTVRNDTGVVQLEKPGYKPLREVAGSLAEFLGRLEPVRVTQTR